MEIFGSKIQYFVRGDPKIMCLAATSQFYQEFHLNFKFKE
jgi:hypothetical protein